ncbi:MAG: hypothetical protein JO352_08250 [Chloroflexi bacterium]|nr:hypothetical protein [Chloroflexota bacterium]
MRVRRAGLRMAAREAEVFVGRGWLLDRVADWLDSAPPVLAITGLAGTGKSAVARRLAQLSALAGEPPPERAPDRLPAPGWLAAVHVCQAQADASRDPARFVETLSAQLSDRLPGLAQARDQVLASLSATPIRVSGEAHATSVASGARNVGAYVALSGLSVRELTDRLLRRPLERLAMDWSSPPVVLVDALDESVEYGAAASLVDIIRSLGDGTLLRWLVTARPDPRVLDRLPPGFTRVDLIEDCPADADDVAEYVRLRIGPDSSLVARLTAAAAGNFLYARHMLEDLLSHSERLAAARSGVLRFPDGLTEVYQEFLDRELRRTAPPEAARRWQNEYRPLLGALAAAFEPGLTLSQLASMLPGSSPPSTVQDALQTCQQLLEAPRDPAGPWRIYHQSFREFVLSGYAGIVSAGDLHRTIGEALDDEWDGGWPDADEYALAHTAAHLRAAFADASLSRVVRKALGRRLDRLLSQPEYLEARIQRHGARAAANEALRAARALEADRVGGSHAPSVKALSDVLSRTARSLSVAGATPSAPLIVQELHNQAIAQHQAEFAQRCVKRLDALGAPHARLRWRVGGNPRLHSMYAGDGASWLELVVLPDGRLAFAGTDGLVLVWDPDGGSDPVEVVHDTTCRSITGLILLDDGTLAGSTDTGTIWVADPTGGAPPRALRGPEGIVMALVPLPGERLAAGDEHGSIRVWDLQRGSDAVVLRGHAERVMAFSKLGDGRLVSASADGTVRVWDLRGKVEPVVLSANQGRLFAVAVLPDDRVVAAGDNGVICAWDVAKPAQPVILGRHGRLVEGMVVLRGGRLATWNGGVCVWDTAGERPPLFVAPLNGGVKSLVELQDGRLAVGANDGTLHVWDPGGGAPELALRGHADPIEQLVQLRDGRVASAGWDGTVRVWDVTRDEHEPVAGHSGWVRALAALPNGRFASGGQDGGVYVWRVTGRAKPELLGVHSDWVEALTALPRERLASAGGDGTVRVWDLERQSEPLVLHGHTGYLTKLATLVDGRVASAGEDGNVCVWDPDAAGPPLVLTGHRFWIAALRALADGRVASVGSDSTLRLWDPAGGAEVSMVACGAGPLDSLVLLTDGRLAYSVRSVPPAYWSHRVQVWDPAGKRPLIDLAPDPPREVAHLVDLPDGRLAFASSGRVCLWLPQAGAELVELGGHRNAVRCLTPMGENWLVSAGYSDGTVRVWDTARGRELMLLPEVQAYSTCVVGPNLLAVGHAEGWVSVYELVAPCLEPRTSRP